MDKSHKFYRPLHLSKGYNAAGRLERKLLAKSDWYKMKRCPEDGGEQEETDQIREVRKQESRKKMRSRGKLSRRLEKEDGQDQPGPPSTIMFVPWTKQGKLVGELKKHEDRISRITGFRIKFIEEGGTPIWRQFSTKLRGGEAFGRGGCYTCRQDDDSKVNCYTRSTVYESSCLLCHPGGKKDKMGSTMVEQGGGLYIGETSRSLYERVGEHFEDANKLERESHMVKHWFLHHQEETKAPKFKFRILGQYRDAMTRQIKEALRVQNRPGNLNSKGEFGGQTIPRLVVEQSEYEKRKDDILKNRQNEEEDSKWAEFMEGKEDKSVEVVQRKRGLPDLVTGQQYQDQPPTKKFKESCTHTHYDEPISNTKIVVSDFWLNSDFYKLIETIRNNTAQSVPPEGERNGLCVSLGRVPQSKTLPETDTSLRIVINQKKGVVVKGGRKGKGAPCMTVLSLKDFFKDLSTKSKVNNCVNSIQNSPKRKLLEETLSSSSKKIRINDAKNVLKEISNENPDDQNSMGQKKEAKSVSGKLMLFGDKLASDQLGPD